MKILQENLMLIILILILIQIHKIHIIYINPILNHNLIQTDNIRIQKIMINNKTNYMMLK